MKKILSFITFVIVLGCVISVLVVCFEPKYELEERYIENENLLFCFSVSQFGGGNATYYQVGKDGTLLRGSGYAESERITDRGYFLTYDEVIAENTDTVFTPEDLGIKYHDVKLSKVQMQELADLLANCMNLVDEGTEKIDDVHTERLLHALYCDGKTYYEWADRRGHVKDPLSLIGYKLEELSGIEESRYQGDAAYFAEVKEHLQSDATFTSEYGKVMSVSAARNWPVRQENGVMLLPFTVKTKDKELTVYIRIGGKDANGKTYMYEFEVAE
ncbi:MAG: hypothetical protein IJN63_10870 [Clostridia bacterium]|nr:hypothetical protein [Clostridia bacterium]